MADVSDAGHGPQRFDDEFGVGWRLVTAGRRLVVLGGEVRAGEHF